MKGIIVLLTIRILLLYYYNIFNFMNINLLSTIIMNIIIILSIIMSIIIILLTYESVSSNSYHFKFYHI